MVEQTHLSRPASPASMHSARSVKGKEKATNTRLSPIQRRWMEAALDAARVLDLDYTRLGLGPEKEAEGDDTSAETGEEEPAAFDWDGCELDQMLVFSPDDLPALFDAAITVDPVRQRGKRIGPANIVFLSARYALRFGQADLLDDLLLGAVDRIEEAVHVRPCLLWP